MNTAFLQMFGELDGKLRRPVNEKWGAGLGGLLPSQLWEPIFCFNCGTPGGYVTKATPIFYQCQYCAEVYGQLPLPQVVPTEEFVKGG